MNSFKFQELYERLNIAQKNAVDAIEGPVMVVAGPGTGKTQILTLRIANILRKTDTDPESILALTFTESGVAAMRRRLLEIIGAPAYSVVISTFHGFCNDVIKNYPEEFPRIIGSQNITEVDQIRVIESLIGELPLKELRPFGDTLHYVREIMSRINDLKRENVSPLVFADVVEREHARFLALSDLYHEKGPHKGKMKGDYLKELKQIDKNKELARVYARYEEELSRNRWYDWSDMIMEVVRELETNEDLLRTLQEQHQYVLVDEHQDTNNAQNRVTELLCNFHPNPNIFVVGDEKQAIFRFQGASLENFAHFKKLYPNAELIILEENYRSTQSILDSAQDIISKSVHATSAPLRSTAGHPEKKISIHAFSRPEVEAYFVTTDIKEKISRGVPPSDIVVLYRDNRDALPFVRMCERFGVPFVVESDQDVMVDPDMRKLLLLLRVANEVGADDLLLKALHVDFLGVEPLDVYKIAAYASKHRLFSWDIVRSESLLKDVGVGDSEKINHWFRMFSSWASLSKNRGLTEAFEIIARESGFVAHLLGLPDVTEKMDKLNGLFDEIKSLAEKHKEYSLSDFLAYLDTLAAHNLLVKKNAMMGVPNRVRLMTAHKSKGQEFACVYIVNAYDGHWGNKRRPSLLKLPLAVFAASGEGFGAGNDMEDERRLFFVAVTRAKKEIVVSYSKSNESKREQLPCQFIEEIRPELVEIADIGRYEKEFSEQKELMFRAPILSEGNWKEKEFIKELFSKNGLSVSALNNYLECPWKYFYTNLIRIPKAKTKHEMYGTAVHSALKDFFENLKDRDLTKEFLLEKFFFYLNREPISKSDFDESRVKGERALSGYYDAYYGVWPRQTIVEKDIAGVMLTPEIRLTGKIDKVEFVGAGIEVNVVDYKTSKPKTRGEIEGSTKNSEGNIKRQLVFYNILLNRFEEGKRFKMVSADVDFIEPDEKGRYHKERFEVTNSEMAELEALAQKTGEEILNLSFLNSTCGVADCEFCALRQAMK